jgi:Protein of unknown function (DUF5661)
MYYLGFLEQNTKDVVIFKSLKAPKKGDFSYFVRVMGPYSTEDKARKGLIHVKEAYGEYGYRENPSQESREQYRLQNPAVSERQRRFMCSDLGRLRSGKRTRTTMTERQLRDYCVKSNPARVLESQIRRGIIHELEHTTDREIARKIACDHLREDPKYYTHLAKMEKQYIKKNYLSDRKALALTKKVIAIGKKLFKHEQSEIRKGNPASEHFDKFIRGMKTLEKYAVGSKPYIDALAKTYADLQVAKKEMGK